MKSPFITTNKRPAFTIIELLVALALVLFIMSIISQVFVDTSEAFRSQRAKAELSEKLRFITQTLRADLRASHFENNRRLSDDDFWSDGPPKMGYFRLEQARPYTEVSSLTGNDKAYISNESSGTVLAFTSFLHGNDQRGFHSINLNKIPRFKSWKDINLTPGDTRFEGSAYSYNTPSAEVAWFIDPSRSPLPILLQDEPDAPTVQLFNLYRKVLPLLPESVPNAFKNGEASVDYEKDVSTLPSQPSTVFNASFSEEKPNVDVPMRRGMGIYLEKDPRIASSWKDSKFDFTLPASTKGKVAKDLNLGNFLIAENVLSFTVEVLPIGATQFYPLIEKSSLNMEKGIFDTWCGRTFTDEFYPTTSPPISFSPTVLDFKSNWELGGTDPNLKAPRWVKGGSQLPQFKAIRVTIRLYDTNNALSPTKTTWQATVVEQL